MGLSRLDVATSLRGRDMGSGVDSTNGVATLATVARLGLMSRHGIAMSRHRLVFRMSRHGVDVAT